ncbi:MAG: catalase [Deltaproteobacteria bacterium]|nr:catalase [Deltaproteobacteria bacterium]
MATKKSSGNRGGATKDKSAPQMDGTPVESTAKSTVSGPSHPDPSAARRNAATKKQAVANELAAAFPFNENKAAEHDAGGQAPPGKSLGPRDLRMTGSTLTETTHSDKTGTSAMPGFNPLNQPLDHVRVDSGNRTLTTNQGVPIADNQNSLKDGDRGAVLLEDFILREKITHFDHERIPERIVHARGSGAHGFFECYEPLSHLTKASLFAAKGKRTPVFVRFSTVVGERGSSDTARDVRGFAVKFYTDEGNWDLVGNNIPVFFIQDAMKFPDLVHAAKPEPHFGMPQAATAHDTFWDFVSLMPESTHMLMWAMSDRAIPRSYRMMQGFGVHTFRFVDANGASQFVKFHWTPMQGTHSLVWDEAVKISGADPDFHRRDLWEAIESGEHPQWELGVQVFSEKQAESFSFDVLDATKLIPEELVPVTPIGRMVLDRNPDYFFGETEQVAFCTAHIVPGIDFSNDPLLAGRIHSYVDTQITRLGGPNFHQIPINAPIAQSHNHQRDGMHQRAIFRGRVSYEPNSLGGGCPFQAGAAKGFTSFRQPPSGDKVRAKPEKFAEHYNQATLFWKSQTPIERAHIVDAFSFELTRVQTPEIRRRVVSQLRNVDAELAASVAEKLGLELPEAMPRALERTPEPEVTTSAALSLFARPGTTGARGRRVAILIADDIDDEAARVIHAGLSAAGAVPRFLGSRLGRFVGSSGNPIEVESTLAAMPSALFDGMVVPGGDGGVAVLANDGHAIEFLTCQYRHSKPILILGGGELLASAAGLPDALPNGDPDPGLLTDDSPHDGLESFLGALAAHRHFARETDPPLV